MCGVVGLVVVNARCCSWCLCLLLMSVVVTCWLLVVAAVAVGIGC